MKHNGRYSDVRKSLFSMRTQENNRMSVNKQMHSTTSSLVGTGDELLEAKIRTVVPSSLLPQEPIYKWTNELLSVWTERLSEKTKELYFTVYPDDRPGAPVDLAVVHAIVTGNYKPNVDEQKYNEFKQVEFADFILGQVRHAITEHDWGEVECRQGPDNLWGRDCKKCNITQYYGHRWGSNKYCGFSQVSKCDCRQSKQRISKAATAELTEYLEGKKKLVVGYCY